MTKMTKYRDYVVDKKYLIHAQGFNEPIEGKIVDIETTEAEDEILLVIEESNGTLTRVFVTAITGYSSKRIAA